LILPRQPEVLSLDPQLLGDVVNNIRTVGRATGTEERADEIAEGMEARIEAVSARAADADTKPSVLHVEWADPLMCGGHWVPEMVDIAGGSNTFGDKDTGTFKLEWDEVVERQPEVIVMMPCGFDVKRGLEDVPILAEREGWKDLPAVRNDRVYVVDASAYTSRSGPRLVTGLEIMAEMIHPELFSGYIPEQGALRLFNA
jgi:iron complex transport system substrate-binding protein